MLPQQSPRFDRVNQVPLLDVAVADLVFGESLLGLFGYVAAFIGHFDKVIGHDGYKGGTKLLQLITGIDVQLSSLTL